MESCTSKWEVFLSHEQDMYNRWLCLKPISAGGKVTATTPTWGPPSGFCQLSHLSPPGNVASYPSQGPLPEHLPFLLLSYLQAWCHKPFYHLLHVCLSTRPACQLRSWPSSSWTLTELTILPCCPDMSMQADQIWALRVLVLSNQYWSSSQYMRICI